MLYLTRRVRPLCQGASQEQMNAPAQIARPCGTWTVKGATLLCHCRHCDCSYTQNYMCACSVWHSTPFQTERKGLSQQNFVTTNNNNGFKSPHLQGASSSHPVKQLWAPFLFFERGTALPSTLKVLNKGHSLTWAGELEEVTLTTQLLKPAAYTSCRSLDPIR